MKRDFVAWICNSEVGSCLGRLRKGFCLVAPLYGFPNRWGAVLAFPAGGHPQVGETASGWCSTSRVCVAGGSPQSWSYKCITGEKDSLQQTAAMKCPPGCSASHPEEGLTVGRGGTCILEDCMYLSDGTTAPWIPKTGSPKVTSASTHSPKHVLCLPQAKDALTSWCTTW